MLTKALLTGGVLSILAGSIVYFGTEGADALENTISDTLRVEDTELAGAADVSVGDASVDEIADVSAEEVADVSIDEVIIEDEVIVEDDVIVEDEVIAEDEVLVANVEVQAPIVEVEDPKKETSQPKTKWLDQYLKKSQPKKASDEVSKEDVTEKETSSATTYESESDADADADADDGSSGKESPEEVAEELAEETSGDILADEPSSAKKYMDKSDRAEMAEMDVDSDDESDEKADRKARQAVRKKKEKMRDKKRAERKWARSTAKGRDVASNDVEIETLDTDEDIDIEILKEELGIDSNNDVQIRIIKKKMGDGEISTMLDTKPKVRKEFTQSWKDWIATNVKYGQDRDGIFAILLDHGFDFEDIVDEMGYTPSRPISELLNPFDSSAFKMTKSEKTVDYAPILVEAKKLLVVDMRNQAFLEIIDHAVDQGDVAQAADIVEELSTPELRDTARARIGTGLARSGNRDAAFAVLDELEIDELSAPIRLEIITALMATKQERKNFAAQR